MILSQLRPTGNTRTSVRYNRAIRQWQAVNGQVINCESQDRAMLTALAHDYPRLGEIVTDLARIHGDHLTGRLLRAAQLITRGHVYAGGEVHSQTQADKVYKTAFTGLPKTYVCDCPDNATDPILGQCCKHALSQHIAYLAGIELPAARPF